MQAAGGVDDYDVAVSGLGSADAVIHDGGGVAALLVADNVHPGAFRPDAELLGRGSAEGVARAEQDFFALRLELSGELADGRRLADAVDAYHKDDRGLGVELQCRVADVQKLCQYLDKPLARLVAIAEAALPCHLLEPLYDRRRGRRADVGHHEQLFKLVIEVIIIGLVALEYLLKILKIEAGLGQAAEYFIEKSHVFTPLSFSAHFQGQALSR